MTIVRNVMQKYDIQARNMIQNIESNLPLMKKNKNIMRVFFYKILFSCFHLPTTIFPFIPIPFVTNSMNIAFSPSFIYS